jgi:hypothetical protein
MIIACISILITIDISVPENFESINVNTIPIIILVIASFPHQGTLGKIPTLSGIRRMLLRPLEECFALSAWILRPCFNFAPKVEAAHTLLI